MVSKIDSRRDLQWVLKGGSSRAGRLARKVLTWLMDSGRLLEYSLARKLELELEASLGIDPGT